MAQSTWNGLGTDWNTAGNWTPNGVPMSGGEARFNIYATPLNLSTSANTSIGMLTFLDAPAHTITLGDNLNINTGVLNNSGMIQTIATGAPIRRSS